MEALPPRPPFSPAETLVEVPRLSTLSGVESEIEKEPVVDAPVQTVSTFRRYFLLFVFCVAQFLDSFYNNALFVAIPPIKAQMDMTSSDAAWLFSSYSLTFASFLLMSGRISDVYNPKYAFFVGIFGLGVVSIGSGFLNSKIVLLVLRAVSGIFAAMTIPSALRLLVYVFPDPDEQARAIGIFGGSGAVASVLGLIIGGFLVQWASWPWVFWLAAIIAIPIAIVCLFFIPDVGAVEIRNDRFRSLDVPGVSILTSALILFIFGISSSTEAGWGSAMVLAPVIISIALVVAFFYWETIVPENRAAIPPSTWSYANFGVLLSVALLPYLWWANVFTMFTTYWQEIYGWSAVSAALHILPIGVLSTAMSFSSGLARRYDTKWLILSGMTGMMIGTILLAFADGPDRYWPITFPAFVIGSGGTMITFTHTNIAIFRTTPSEAAGTVGACLNSALQLGVAVCLAVSTSIESAIEKHEPDGFASYAGRRAVFWFVLGVVGLEAVCVVIFYRPRNNIKNIAPAATKKGNAIESGEKLPRDDSPA